MGLHPQEDDEAAKLELTYSTLDDIKPNAMGARNALRVDNSGAMYPSCLSVCGARTGADTASICYLGMLVKRYYLAGAGFFFPATGVFAA